MMSPIILQITLQWRDTLMVLPRSDIVIVKHYRPWNFHGESDAFKLQLYVVVFVNAYEYTIIYVHLTLTCLSDRLYLSKARI